MSQPYPPPYPHGAQQAPDPQYAQPGQVPDPRQWAQPPYQAPPPVPVPAAKKRKWPWIVGGIVLLFFVAGVSGGNDRPPTPNTPTAPTWQTAQAAQPPQPLAAPDAEPEEEAPAPSGPQTTFGDGTWVVGEDIVAGTYKSPGAKEGIFEYCQITTHSDDTAQSDFLDWQNGNAGEPIRVKVGGKVKSVKVTGCEDFTKVG